MDDVLICCQSTCRKEQCVNLLSVLGGYKPGFFQEITAFPPLPVRFPLYRKRLPRPTFYPLSKLSRPFPFPPNYSLLSTSPQQEACTERTLIKRVHCRCDISAQVNVQTSVNLMRKTQALD